MDAGRLGGWEEGRQGGKLHLSGTKSNMLKCLEHPGKLQPASLWDGKVMDGPVNVHCLLTNVSILHEYADRIFIPYNEMQPQNAT